jgi:hypothetical protein
MNQRPIADILALPPSAMPSVEFAEAQRVRRIAITSLRSKQVASWTAQSLCRRARCKREVAQSALHTLAAWKLIVRSGAAFELAPVVLEGTNP